MHAQKSIRAGAVVLSLMYCLSISASAGHDGFHEDEKWEEKHEEKMREIHKQLGLTPDQEKQLEEHRKAHREQAKALRAQLKEKREALRLELEKPQLDMDRISAVHAEMKQIHDKLADHRLQGILEVRRIVSAEQFKKFHELMKERRHGRKRGRGSPGPGHDGPEGME